MPRSTSKTASTNSNKPPKRSSYNSAREYGDAIVKYHQTKRNQRQQSRGNLGPRPSRADFKTGEAYRKALIAYVKKKNG